MIELTALLMASLAPSIPNLISSKRKGKSSSINPEPKSLLFIGKDLGDYKNHFADYTYNYLTAKNCLIAFYKLEKLANSYPHELPSIVICDHNLLKEGDYSLVAHIRCNDRLSDISLIIIGSGLTAEDKYKLIDLGIIEFYDVENEYEQLQNRLGYFKNPEFKTKIKDYSKDRRFKYQTNIFKRIFDIASATFLLIIFAPLMLLIAAIIKLGSDGPLFYISKRAGAGYRIFNFYKFRTMVPDADQKLIQLKDKNQYAGSSTTLDPEFYFVKIKDDPRITGFGRFLRNTSLDELPQLFNVLKGDMSIIGNRPLPLYEAEQLKRDKWAKRFLAPAGITGLWQITKRGGKKMSALQRIALDILYAEQGNLWTDIKILFLTIPAMFQRESV